MGKNELKLISIAFLVVGLFWGCDSHKSVVDNTPQVTFSAEMTIVKDFSQGLDMARIDFGRNGEAFNSATIKIGADTVRLYGAGIYFAETPLIHLLSQNNTISFACSSDSYMKDLTFIMPGNLAITNVYPRYNQGVNPVQVDWSNSDGASGYVLTVIARNYGHNGTSPLTTKLTSDSHSITIPTTAFETSSGNPVADIYYIYVVAYNGGFGPFPGMKFPLPSNLPAEAISEPNGHIRVGVVAPADSVIVPI
jgi:hypothetical protein